MSHLWKSHQTLLKKLTTDDKPSNKNDKLIEKRKWRDIGTVFGNVIEVAGVLKSQSRTHSVTGIPLYDFCHKITRIYVSLRLRVQNAAPAQPCVGKLGISLVCNFRLWFKTP